jgi:hypothetical protein
MSNVTAIEARIASAMGYHSSKGTNQGEDLSCDGGPLANTAHDPRCAYNEYIAMPNARALNRSGIVLGCRYSCLSECAAMCE